MVHQKVNHINIIVPNGMVYWHNCAQCDLNVLIKYHLFYCINEFLNCLGIRCVFKDYSRTSFPFDCLRQSRDRSRDKIHALVNNMAILKLECGHSRTFM